MNGNRPRDSNGSIFYEKGYPVICEEGRVVMGLPVDRRKFAAAQRVIRCFEKKCQVPEILESVQT